MASSNLIKIKAYYNGCSYPKYPQILGKGDNTFGITHWDILDVEEGEPLLNKRSGSESLAIKGNFFEPLKHKTPYTIIATNPETNQYGVTYELMYINEIIDFESTKGQIAFLKTFLTNGQIAELYKVYKDPLKIIADHNIEGLKKVKGVKEYIANCIIERYEANKDVSSIYMELEGYGLTSGLIGKMMAHYKNPHKIISIVKNNPYLLTYEVDGIGFLTADRIAMSGGLSTFSEERIKAYIVYFLTEEANEEGNSYVSAGTLREQIYYFFGGKEKIYQEYTDDEGNVIGSNIGSAIKSLITDNIITIEDGPDKAHRRVYLNSVYNLEKSIAFHLKRLLSAPNKFYYKDWKDRIKQQEKVQGYNFDEDQLAGIKLGLDNQVCLINGGAGVGKSSLVGGILAALSGYSYAQCALSGKAASRLQEVTHEEGLTIHRLLGYAPVVNKFTFNEDNPLGYDIIVLDEISLVGGEIFLSLLKAIPTGTKLLMLGDNGQLPSIGLLNLASDMIESKVIPSVQLTKIHRQAAESGIITDSAKIRSQNQLFAPNFTGTTIHGNKQDMTIDISDTSDTTADRILSWFDGFFDGQQIKGDINKIQILSPVKDRGKASVYALNCEIQHRLSEKLGPFIVKTPSNREKRGGYDLHVGDKVKCTKNLYRHCFNSEEEIVPVYNGWFGIIKYYDPHTNTVGIKFDLSNKVIYMPVAVAKVSLILGYAATVHSSQGSDWPVVIGAIDTSIPPSMLNSALVYTMITRAKSLCVLVGQNRAISRAISVNAVNNKNTFLKEMLGGCNE